MTEHISSILDDFMKSLTPEACAARMKARAAPFTAFVTFDERSKTFDLIQPDCGPYCIPVSDFPSTRELTRWLAHLIEKPWVTPMHLAGLVTLVDIHIGLYRLYNKESKHD
jgi:hypothetical protein